ncbi:MAG: LytTR family transcriptional regulator [Saprospiraceae bacterium]|nr:LytTR family transcriptional regulator [Saprospiraceae bacterium]
MYIKKIASKKDQIMYCESTSNYTWIYFDDGSKILLAKTLKMLESFLTSYTFIRIHSKYLVNRKWISSYSKVNYEIKLYSDKNLPVAKRRRSAVKKSLFSSLV